MDYQANARFFDRKFRKSNARMRAIGAASSGVGGVCVAISMFMRWGGYAFYVIGWPLLIFGVVVLLVAANKRVRESDVTSQADIIIDELKELCKEKLDYPEDFDSRALVFAGSVLNDENISAAKKLKSGNYLGSDLVITIFYEKKGSLFIMQRTISFVKEGHTDIEKNLSFNDFDSVGVETDTLKNGAKINSVRFYKDGTVFLEAPLVDNDYYKEEYFVTLMHDKERFSRTGR